jgi:hypothetical protein
MTIEGKPVPTELRNTGDTMKADLPFDEAQTGKQYHNEARTCHDNG